MHMYLTGFYLRILPLAQYFSPKLQTHAAKLTKINNKGIHLISLHFLSVNVHTLLHLKLHTSLCVDNKTDTLRHVNICKITEEH